MTVNERIVFVWKGEHFTVPKAANPIILPGGEVLKGDGWANEVFPPNPGKLSHLFNIHCITLGLKDVADALGGVLAVRVTVKKINICPRGCTKPTNPFCKKCGEKVEVTYEIEPKNKTDKI